MTRSREPGTVTRSQFQPPKVDISSASRAPNHKISRPPGASLSRAHRMSSAWSPNALQVIVVKQLTSLCRSCHRALSTRTSESPSVRAASDKNAHFFVFGSIRMSFQEGSNSLRANPGKPAPLPMSNRTPPESCSQRMARKLSEKFLLTISRGSLIVVRFSFWFQRSNNSI